MTADKIDELRVQLGDLEEVDMPADMACDVSRADDRWSHDGVDHISPDSENPVPPFDGAASGEDDPPEKSAAVCLLNDLGNGERFRIYHGEDCIFVPRVGWHQWDGMRWRLDPDELDVRGRAQNVAARMLAEISHIALESWEKARVEDGRAAEAELKVLAAKADLTGEEEAARAAASEKVAKAEAVKRALSTRKKDHRTFAKSSGNSGKIDAMLKEARVALAVQNDDLNPEPLLVNCRNGTLAAAVTGEGYNKVPSIQLRPHDRSDRITKVLSVDYDQDATCPTFDAFLKRIQPDQEMREFLQRTFGLCLTSLMEQRMWFFYGGGSNGKSVLSDIIAWVLGDYSATAKIESLTGQSRRGGSDATPDLMHLIGATMVRASEPEQGEKLKEGTIKEMTGGEPILVRALHADFIEVKPRFKLIISGNHKPRIDGTDEGIWRRMLLVPFSVEIPESERDRNLGEKLKKEGAGILRWMVKGLLDYLELGLQVPDSVRDATKAYREESDPVGQFLADTCTVTGDGNNFIRTKQLVEAFNYWIEERGETAWRPRTISLRLKDKAGQWRDPRTGLTFTAAKVSVEGYRGIELQPSFVGRMTAATSGVAQSPYPDDEY